MANNCGFDGSPFCYQRNESGISQDGSEFVTSKVRETRLTHAVSVGLSSELDVETYECALTRWVLDPSEKTSRKVKLHVKDILLNLFHRKETSLSLSNANLCSVPPLFGLPQLTDIDLKDNHITEVSSDDFIHQRGLQTLLLSNNSIRQIHHLDLSNRSDFYMLDLSHNQITAFEGLNLSNCPKMHLLYLSGNPVQSMSHLNFSNCISLDHFSLKNLPHLEVVETIDFSNCTGLWNVEISNTSIKELGYFNFSNCIVLESVVLRKNRLQRMPVWDMSQCIEFERLDVSSNRLSEFPLTSRGILSDRLIGIDLSHNSFKRVDDWLFSVTTTYGLMIDMNQNLLDADYLRILEDRQAELGYEGPTFFVSKSETIKGSLSLLDLPSILCKWKHDAMHPVWKMITLTPVGHENERNYLFFVSFLDRLFNETFKESGADRLQSEIRYHVETILEILERVYVSSRESLFDRLLEQCCEMSSEYLDWNSDELLIGLSRLSQYLLKNH